MALSAGTYQGRIGSRTYSMRRNWPVDNVSMISDYKGVMYRRGVAGVGCCGDDMVGISGLGVAAPAWTSDPTQIIGYYTRSADNPVMPGASFVVTKGGSDPFTTHGPGTFSATDPQTGKLAPGLAAQYKRTATAIQVVGAATVLGLALFAMRG